MVKTTTLVVLVLAMLFAGCATHHHQVGLGATGNDVESERQWYILWGLVPLNKVDTKQMADGATDYEITTEFTVIDWLLGLVTGIATINSRTVEVRK